MKLTTAIVEAASTLSLTISSIAAGATSSSTGPEGHQLCGSPDSAAAAATRMEQEHQQHTPHANLRRLPDDVIGRRGGGRGLGCGGRGRGGRGGRGRGRGGGHGGDDYYYYDD